MVWDGRVIELDLFGIPKGSVTRKGDRFHPFCQQL